MTLTVDGVTAEMIKLIRNHGEEAIEFWQSLDGGSLILQHHGIGRSIRNHFKMWEDGAMPEGVHPDDMSMRVIEAVYAQVKDWDLETVLAEIAAEEAARPTVEHIDELNEDEFELAEGDLSSLEPTSYPTLPAATAAAMKEFTWVHTSGTEYEILEIANLEADVDRRMEYPVTVVYRNKETGAVWSKSLDRFHASMSRRT